MKNTFHQIHLLLFKILFDIRLKKTLPFFIHCSFKCSLLSWYILFHFQPIKWILHLVEFLFYARRNLRNIVATQLTRCKLEFKKCARSKIEKLKLIEMSKTEAAVQRCFIRKRCSENMQQIYRRKPMLNSDLNKIASNFIEITLRHGCSPVNLLHNFKTPFPKNTSGGLLL